MIHRPPIDTDTPPADGALEPRVQREVACMREALVRLIELSGLTRREVEQRLREGGTGTDLGRLLGGRLDLKVQHVLAICRVIDLEPWEFFQIALKPRPGQRSPCSAGSTPCCPSPGPGPPRPRLCPRRRMRPACSSERSTWRSNSRTSCNRRHASRLPIWRRPAAPEARRRQDPTSSTAGRGSQGDEARGSSAGFSLLPSRLP
jgi:hypothetical protein